MKIGDRESEPSSLSHCPSSDPILTVVDLLRFPVQSARTQSSRRSPSRVRLYPLLLLSISIREQSTVRSCVPSFSSVACEDPPSPSPCLCPELYMYSGPLSTSAASRCHCTHGEEERESEGFAPDSPWPQLEATAKRQLRERGLFLVHAVYHAKEHAIFSILPETRVCQSVISRKPFVRLRVHSG